MTKKIFENLIMLGYLGKCMTLFYRVNQKTMGRSDDLFLTKLVGSEIIVIKLEKEGGFEQIRWGQFGKLPGEHWGLKPKKKAKMIINTSRI